MIVRRCGILTKITIYYGGQARAYLEPSRTSNSLKPLTFFWKMFHCTCSNGVLNALLSGNGRKRIIIIITIIIITIVIITMMKIIVIITIKKNYQLNFWNFRKKISQSNTSDGAFLRKYLTARSR